MGLIQVLQQLRQELQLFNLIILSVLFLISAFFLFKLTRTGKLNSPPSPPRLPIIGNLHQIGNVHHSLQALSEKYGPVMLLQFGSVPIIVVSSADIARDLFKTHDATFSGRPRIKAADVFFYGCSDIAFCPYGEYWRQAKKLCVLELLSIKRVQSFQFVREEEVAELVEKIRISCQKGSLVNLGEMLGKVSMNVISRCSLGQKYEGVDGNDGSAQLSRRVIELLGAFSFEDYCPYLGWMDKFTGLNARLKEASGTFNTFLDKVIDQHQIPNGHNNDQIDKKDFVDIVLNLQNDGLLDIDLTRDNLKAILLDIFVGGSDTSATTMEWTMAELVKNPTKMKKAQEEVRRVVGKKIKVDEADLDQMDYLKCVIKETLRLHAPFLIARETTTSVTLAGYEIPPKTRVLINSWSIQRDPKSWDRTEEFLPERFLNNSIDLKGQDPRFFPFGSGRRGCPGTSFAVVEIEYVIANLLFWFDWKLPGDAAAEDLDMSDAFKQVICKKIPLTLVPELHPP